MPVMRSFCFGKWNGHNSIPEKVLRLFSELGMNPEKQTEYAYDIIDMAIHGRWQSNYIDFDKFGFSKKKYEKLKKYREEKKKVYLINSDIEIEDRQPKTITEEELSANRKQKLIDEYEKLLDAFELELAVKYIREHYYDFISDYKVDIFVLIKQATLGVKKSIEILKKICEGEDNEEVREYIKAILDSKKSFEELFGG